MTGTPGIPLWKLALIASVTIFVGGASSYAATAREPGYTEEVLRPGEVDPNALSANDEMPVSREPEDQSQQSSSNNASEPRGEMYDAEIPRAADEAQSTIRKKSKKGVAAAARDIPLIETQNEVTSAENVVYVTGGVGDDERQAIEASKADYNVHITNTSKTGAFEGDVHVIITEQGQSDTPMLNLVSGPLLYVHLPQGKYMVTATLGERKISKPFTLKKKGKPVNMNLSW